MSGILRWVGDSNEWHLSFGGDWTLCEQATFGDSFFGPFHMKTRWLQEGAPASRCAKCSEVIRFRLGLEPRDAAK